MSLPVAVTYAGAHLTHHSSICHMSTITSNINLLSLRARALWLTSVDCRSTPASKLSLAHLALNCTSLACSSPCAGKDPGFSGEKGDATSLTHMWAWLRFYAATFYHFLLNVQPRTTVQRPCTHLTVLNASHLAMNVHTTACAGYQVYQDCQVSLYSSESHCK